MVSDDFYLETSGSIRKRLHHSDIKNVSKHFKIINGSKNRIIYRIIFSVDLSPSLPNWLSCGVRRSRMDKDKKR